MKTPVRFLRRLVLIASLCASAPGLAVVQMGLIIDASSSTQGELPTFRQGVANALAGLKTDGSVELTLVQFSAVGAVIFGPSLIDSVADRQLAVDAAMGIDPATTDIPPFNGGTNIEDGLAKTRLALQGSPLAGQATSQFVNMLTDGNPSVHNHLTLQDLDPVQRHLRGQEFARQERDAMIAAGFDVISFEALGADADDIDFLETMTYPGQTWFVNPPGYVFPDPIESRGFLLPIATVFGIEAALRAKFEAAGLAIPPVSGIRGTAIEGSTAQDAMVLVWSVEPGSTYRVEYRDGSAGWRSDLPNSLIEAAVQQTVALFTDASGIRPLRWYRLRQISE